MLSIDTGDRSSFQPGETITVGLSWKLEQAPSAVELRTVWNTSGKGTQDVGVASTLTIADPPSDDERQVSIELPGSPYSFSGRLVSVVWALELVALPSRLSARVEIVIGPDGQEVVAAGTGSDESA